MTTMYTCTNSLIIDKKWNTLIMSDVLYILWALGWGTTYTPWKGWHDVTGSKDNILFLPTEENNFFQPFHEEKTFGF